MAKQINYLVEAVKEQGVLTFGPEILREYSGQQRLGKNVCDALRTQLDAAGVGSMGIAPRSKRVRLWDKASMIGALVQAIYEPSIKTDRVLRSFSKIEGYPAPHPMRRLSDLVPVGR